jgi:hypothetical protein
MATFPVATGARLLGIHPKTLHHWLKAAECPLAAHPTDARLKCVAEEHLLELAKQHGRPLLTLSAVPALDSYVASAFAEEQGKPLPPHEGEPAHRAASLSASSASLADLLQQFAQLHTQVATLQHHLVRLTLDLLHERTGDAEQRLRPLEALVSQTLGPVHAPGQKTLAGLPVPSHPPVRHLLPAEVRARSRVTVLIEYGAQGQYVAVCPQQGVLSLVPDSPQWFDWLASLTSFRFVGPAGRFSACRASEKGQDTRCWAALMGTTSGTIWG